jgi:hypothetical protein
MQYYNALTLRNMFEKMNPLYFNKHQKPINTKDEHLFVDLFVIR